MLTREHIDSIGELFRLRENHPVGTFEIEAKFGLFQDGRFDSAVPYVHFDRLLNYYRLHAIEHKEISDVRIHGNRRQIVITPEGAAPQPPPIWEEKTSIWVDARGRARNIDLPEYDLRISGNIERQLTPEEIPADFQPDVVRCRTRHSFYLEGEILRLDLTEVMQITGRTRNQYEVELEFLGSLEQVPIFERSLNQLFQLLRGTHLVFTNTEKHRLIMDANAALYPASHGTRENTIDKDVLSDARNIKSRDLVYGGIVGNEKTNYYITFKADGFRKMLICHVTGIWLVFPPFEYNLVVRAGPGISTFLDQNNGTIFDGEWVQFRDVSSVNPDYWYLAFDCISFRGNYTIQNEPYATRRRVVDALVGSGTLNTNVIRVELKDAKPFNTPDEFFGLVRDFLGRRDSLPYQEDGLMFFPGQTAYNPRAQEAIPRLADRSLVVIPEICKWKEALDITIDFSLRWTLTSGTACSPHHSGLELYSFDTVSKQLVPFRGTKFNPFTLDMLDGDNAATQNKPSGLVVEYEWVWLPEAEKQGRLQPRRIRYDKSGPNRLDVAEDNWDDIMNPIRAEDLMGRTIRFTRSYFNRIKSELFRFAGSRVEGGVLLDIGSGRGGDVNKWKAIVGETGHVYAVEPNAENREELVRRIELNGMTSMVTVLPVGGENTEAIRKIGGVDIVALMLSLSFFWQDTAHLDALVATIVACLKPGGMVIFLTVDGDIIEQIFEPALGGQRITDLDVADAHLHLYPPVAGSGRALNFRLPEETIVGDQMEYLVHLGDLSMRLERHGIVMGTMYRAEGEPFLSSENRLYASMFGYGYYVAGPSFSPSFSRVVSSVVLPPVPGPIRPPVPGPIVAPLVRPPVPVPVQPPSIRAPLVRPPVRAPLVAPPVRAPLVAPPVRAPLVAPPVRAPLVAPPVRAPSTRPH